jgi:hypothetical protein
MNRRLSFVLASPFVAAALLAGCSGSGSMWSTPPKNPMTFFVTSANPGKGGDLGGLAGADKYCQALANSVDAGGSRVWRAYLSTTPANGLRAVNARDRIGSGPWTNAKGVVIARNVGELHGKNMIDKTTALTEKGEPVPGRGEPVNMHDILTGSSPDGRAIDDGKDTTCGNWTSSSEGSTIVGHHDRNGTNADPVAAASWNSSHPTRGCSMDGFKSTGGAGLLYCFAAQ